MFNFKNQQNAIENSMHNLGWQNVKVTLLHINSFDSDIHNISVKFGLQGEFNFELTLGVDVNDVFTVSSKNTIFLKELRAIEFALKDLNE